MILMINKIFQMVPVVQENIEKKKLELCFTFSSV